MLSSRKARLQGLAAIVLVSLTVASLSSARSARALSFQDRVAAHEAIERVYYAHQIGATAPFETAVPREVIERKVRTYLKQSAALEARWGVPVTAEALRGEWMRIVRNTRLPERLEEIRAALGADPFLIQECFARATLVERQIRSLFASDERIHRRALAEMMQIRDQIEKRTLDPLSPHPRRRLIEIVERGPDSADRRAGGLRAGAPGESPAPSQIDLDPAAFARHRSLAPERAGEAGPIVEEREAFVTRVLLEESPGSALIAAYVVPKRSYDSWWARVEGDLDEGSVLPVADPFDMEEVSIRTTLSDEECAPAEPVAEGADLVLAAAATIPCDTWENGSLGNVQPDERMDHTAVWTGSLMLIWGGSGSGGPLDSGARYDPATDSWTPITRLDAPSARSLHTAVWTGSRMVVWGGVGSGLYLNSGGRYAPLTDTWTPTTTALAPAARAYHTAVWSGTEMIVWGGRDSRGNKINTGGRYDPTGNSWQATSTGTGVPAARDLHAAVWAVSRMIVWGGYSSSSAPLNTGAIYNPATDAWATMTTSGAPAARYGHTAVFSGDEMIVWGGMGASSPLNTGGRYDVKTTTWASTSTTGAPAARAGHTGVWTGTLMIVWGGGDSKGGVYNSGGRYDPAGNAWSATSTQGVPAGRSGHTAVWGAGRMIVWGGQGALSNKQDTGGRYNPLTNLWSPTAAAAVPAPRTEHTAVWTGSVMIIWGGTNGSSDLDGGARYDPTTDDWISMTTINAPSGRVRHAAVWSGDVMIVWGGRASGVETETGGRYDPAANTWQPTSLTNVPAARAGHTAVWSGTYMVVWGGLVEPATLLNTGGRYEPAADVWLAVSTAGAPEARFAHTAVRAGTQMIVWGGEVAGGAPTDTGGRYSFSTDTWRTTSLTNAPAARVGHTAVWSGTRMIVWGGGTASGGRYDPSANGWSATSEAGAPTARSGHTAIWMGNGMVVWGGVESGGSQYPSVGGRYDLASDTWAATTDLDAPAGRTSHTAVWTGTHMIVWGGGNPWLGRLNSGGRYVPLSTTDKDADGHTVCDDCDDEEFTVHPGAPEICDNLDNDCNGSVDGFGTTCGVGACAGTGTCTGGVDDCVPGSPSAEICDDVDNNCDGVTDGFATSCGVGACASTGICTAGVDDCVPGSPAAESCNNLDDDCDGTVDDGNPGGGAPCSTGLPGACAAGTTTCQAGSLTCVPDLVVTPEVCDNADNNCDGQTDEGNPGGGAPCSTGEPGVCSAGTMTCQAGGYVCVRNVAPSQEVCDNLDNDCNGSIDGYITTCGVGACAAQGCCTAGADTCTPGAPSAESCNNVDDDCDGAIDDGNPGGGSACSTGLLGACATGTTTCQGGSIVCQSVVSPSTEICDNVDNDCDGVVDSFTTFCGSGICASAGDCTAGVDTCMPGSPATEVCDGFDNDCDGSTDDLVGADPDGDALDSGCDNCPANYNPGQENTDGTGGGDACQVTVLYPLPGDVSCPSSPPTITWTPGKWTHFKVFVGWDPKFNQRFTSGDKLLTTTQYTPPLKKWNLACLGARPNLYIKVKGKIKGKTGSEFSSVVTLPVK